jgi:hypothetical protein
MARAERRKRRAYDCTWNAQWLYEIQWLVRADRHVLPA